MASNQRVAEKPILYFVMKYLRFVYTSANLEDLERKKGSKYWLESNLRCSGSFFGLHLAGAVKAHHCSTRDIVNYILSCTAKRMASIYLGQRFFEKRFKSLKSCLKFDGTLCGDKGDKLALVREMS